VKKTDLAYVAGIVDGEGCITLARTGIRNSKNTSISLFVTVTNTNIWIIEWLKFAFGGTIYTNRKRNETTNRKAVYTWGLYTLSALEFLKLIYPYLRLKKPQAEIAIKFLEMRGQKGRRFNTEEQEIGESQRIEMGKLNKRGA